MYFHLHLQRQVKVEHVLISSFTEHSLILSHYNYYPNGQLYSKSFILVLKDIQQSVCYDCISCGSHLSSSSTSTSNFFLPWTEPLTFKLYRCLLVVQVRSMIRLDSPSSCDRSRTWEHGLIRGSAHCENRPMAKQLSSVLKKMSCSD